MTKSDLASPENVALLAAFTEGFDTRDLIAAKKLLDELQWR